MLTLLIIILVILALGSGGYGFRSGWYGGSRGTGFNGLGLLPRARPAVDQMVRRPTIAW